MASKSTRILRVLDAPREKPTAKHLAEYFGVSLRLMRDMLRRLQYQEMVTVVDHAWELTPEGQEAMYEEVEA